MTASREKRQISPCYIFLLSCGIALLGGCSGGALGNLIPLPKMLTGAVRHNVYYAKNDLFSINTPYKQDTSDYTYAKIKERYKDDQAFVAFHTSTLPGENYNVDVVRLPQGNDNAIDLDTAADNAIGNIQKMQAAGGREPFVLVGEEPWKATYTTGVIRLYTQRVPAADVTTDSKRKFFTAYNLMYVTKGSGRVAVVLADWVADADDSLLLQKMTVAGADKDPIRKAFSRNARAWAFINSIKLDVATPAGTSGQESNRS